MLNLKVGLQIYSLREDFATDPTHTLQEVAAMGYEGVEFYSGGMKESAAFYRDTLAEVGLLCFGNLTGWNNLQPETISETIAYNHALGSPFIIIGSVPAKLVSTAEDAQRVISYMGKLQKIFNSEGFITGYHNHDSDFFILIDGKPFFSLIFDNTPSDFVMLLDTGNALAAGYSSVDLLRKYPHRSPFLHIKGYSKEKGYLAYIGDDDFDWPTLLKNATIFGGTKSIAIEFGQRGNYDPFERAKTSLDWIKTFMRQKEL